MLQLKVMNAWQDLQPEPEAQPSASRPEASPSRRSPVKQRSSLKRKKRSMQMFPLQSYLQELGVNAKQLKTHHCSRS